MTAAEFADWMAYERLEPWGETRADFRAGMIASTVFNAFRGKAAEPKTPVDFMHKFDAPPKRTDVADIHTRMLAWLPPALQPGAKAPG
ncbi:MAG: DUF4035 domain-containing protein [Novosphingobium sp.]|nr:DUF4035 domain-containing protein [Novosphingobium sp.]